MHLSFIAVRRPSQGLTLIEMMVALVILSIGLLGLAGLQAATTKYRLNTLSRSASTGLVFDLSERIRVNADAAGPSFLQSGSSDQSAYVIASDWGKQQTETVSIEKNCDSETCTSSERADFDLKTWRQKVRSSMPQGSALLSGNKRDGVLLTLMWFDKEFTEKQTKDGATEIKLVKAPICTNEQTGMARQSCCPENAQAPAGVRCSRFSFVP